MHVGVHAFEVRRHADLLWSFDAPAHAVEDNREQALVGCTLEHFTQVGQRPVRSAFSLIVEEAVLIGAVYLLVDEGHGVVRTDTVGARCLHPAADA